MQIRGSAKSKQNPRGLWSAQCSAKTKPPPRERKQAHGRRTNSEAICPREPWPSRTWGYSHRGLFPLSCHHPTQKPQLGSYRGTPAEVPASPKPAGWPLPPPTVALQGVRLVAPASCPWGRAATHLPRLTARSLRGQRLGKPLCPTRKVNKSPQWVTGPQRKGFISN